MKYTCQLYPRTFSTQMPQEMPEAFWSTLYVCWVVSSTPKIFVNKQGTKLCEGQKLSNSLSCPCPVLPVLMWKRSCCSNIRILWGKLLGFGPLTKGLIFPVTGTSHLIQKRKKVKIRTELAQHMRDLHDFYNTSNLLGIWIIHVRIKRDPPVCVLGPLDWESWICTWVNTRPIERGQTLTFRPAAFHSYRG